MCFTLLLFVSSWTLFDKSLNQCYLKVGMSRSIHVIGRLARSLGFRLNRNWTLAPHWDSDKYRLYILLLLSTLFKLRCYLFLYCMFFYIYCCTKVQKWRTYSILIIIWLFKVLIDVLCLLLRELLNVKERWKKEHPKSVSFLLFILFYIL